MVFCLPFLLVSPLLIQLCFIALFKKSSFDCRSFMFPHLPSLVSNPNLELVTGYKKDFLIWCDESLVSWERQLETPMLSNALWEKSLHYPSAVGGSFLCLFRRKPAQGKENIALNGSIVMEDKITLLMRQSDSDFEHKQLSLL
jgi:hypothetical protein